MAPKKKVVFDFAGELQKAVVKTNGESSAPLANISAVEDINSGLSIRDNLFLCFLFGRDTIMSHSQIALAGEEGVNKSALAMGLYARQFVDNGGFVVLIETENKANYEYLKANVGPNFGRVQPYFADSLEDLWSITTQVCKMVEKMAEASEEGEETPVLIIRDSFNGVISEKTSTDIEKSLKKDGDVKNHTAGLRAASINKDAEASLAKYMRMYNITIVDVLHQKEKADLGGGMPTFGPPKKNRAGGKAKDYKQSLVYEVAKRVGNKSVGSFTEVVSLKLIKNSFSKKQNMRFDVFYQTHFLEGVDIHGNLLESCSYDWNRALCEMLVKDGLFRKEDRDKIIQITEKSSTAYTCKTLGVKNPMHPSELGALIHADEELSFKLRRYLFKCRSTRKIGLGHKKANALIMKESKIPVDKNLLGFFDHAESLTSEEAEVKLKSPKLTPDKPGNEPIGFSGGKKSKLPSAPKM